MMPECNHLLVARVLPRAYVLGCEADTGCHCLDFAQCIVKRILVEMRHDAAWFVMDIIDV